MIELAKQYIEDVVNNNIVTCDYVKLAVNRHLEGLERKDWEWVFNEDAAEHALTCIGMMRHTKGREFAKKRFMMRGEQAFITYELFGWRHEQPIIDDELGEIALRRYVKAYVETAKKSGKSEYAGGLLNYGLIFDGEYGAQCHSAATKRDQAMYVFTPARSMCKMLQSDSSALKDLISIRNHRVFIDSTESYMSPLSSDHDSLDGVDSHFTIIDEYHAHKNSGLNDNLENSSVNRTSPLHFIITTAGFNMNGPCYQFRRNVVVPVLKKIKTDDRLFGIIFTLDEGDDWNDPNMWIKSNPGLGQTPKLDKIRKLYVAAKNAGGSKEVDFKTKQLNIWVPASSEWIPDKKWMAPSKKKMEDGRLWIDMTLQEQREFLKGRRCVGGLDLAQSRDICAFELYFPEDEGCFVLSYFWCNAEQAAMRQRNGDPYEDWGRKGYMTITEGDFTDYGYIKNEILEAHAMFDLISISYDPALAKDFCRMLIDEGLQLNPHSQVFQKMNGPTREIEDLARKGLIQHFGNPVLRWMNSNIETKRNSDGHLKIDKSSDTRKVDGMVALVMARSEWVFQQEQEFVYNKQGMRTM